MNYKPLRIAITGLRGQIVSALIERAPKETEIIALGRPQLELSEREAVLSSLRHCRCDVIINAAAYTQVDQAESEPDLAMRVNGDGAGYVARAAAELNVPLIHVSTDYVFDGLLERPYLEEDMANPTCVYGRSKLIGEENIKNIYSNHVILRTAWIYSPFGHNFVKTMLRLGRECDKINVVMDQLGNPTSALEIVDALLVIARRLKEDVDPTYRGIFHFAGHGKASWADVAEHIFKVAELHGRQPVRVKRINMQEYPTAAKRPSNSQLDTGKIKRIYGIACLPWQPSVTSCVERLMLENIGEI